MSLSLTVGKRRTRQRDLIVGNSRAGLCATSRKYVPTGGSSRLFSRAFAAFLSRSSAGSIIIARFSPMVGRVLSRLCMARTWEIRIERASSKGFPSARLRSSLSSFGAKERT